MKQYCSKWRSQRKTHLGVYMTIWSMGPRVLKKLILIMPIKYGIIFLTMKSKKRGSFGGRSHLDAKEKWVSPKMGVWWKCSKTQGSKEILMEIDEGKLKSLEKCFLWEEMVKWRRKIKGKKKMNSVNRGRKVDEDEAKKEKREKQRSKGPKFQPHT